MSDWCSDTEPEGRKRKRTQTSLKEKYLESSDAAQQYRKKNRKNQHDITLPPPPQPVTATVTIESEFTTEKTTDSSSVECDREVLVVENSDQLSQGFSLGSQERSRGSQIQFDIDGSILPISSKTTQHTEASTYDVLSPTELVSRRTSTLEIVMSQLSEIQESVRNLHAKIDSVQLGNVPENDSEFEDDDFNPAETVEDLKAISTQVTQDTVFKRKLISHLSRVGGRSCSKFLYRVLAELMSDKVASNFSYKGQREKMCFEDLRLKSLFLTCLKKNPLTRKGLMTFDVEIGIGDWLKRANQRLERKLSKDLKSFFQHTTQDENVNCSDEDSN